MFAKKVLSLLLSMFLTAVCCSSALAADDLAKSTSNRILSTSPAYAASVKYSYTSSVTASLSFSGNTAYCKGSVTPNGSYSVSITVTLYKQNGSSWDYVASWSDSATNGNKAAASGSASVTSGTYKVTTRGNVGNGLEYPSASVTKTK